MLHWLLDKILPKHRPATPSCEPAASANPPANSAEAAAERSGLLRRRAIYNARWQIVAYTFALRNLAHQTQAPKSEHSHDDVLLCEIERLLETQNLKTQIWLEIGWKNLPLLVQHRFKPNLQIIAHGEVDWPQQQLEAMLSALQHQHYQFGATAKRWHHSHPLLGDKLNMIALSVQSPDFAVLSQQVQHCRQIAPNAQLWVNEVDSREAAEACFQLGADFVSGRVFNWPEAQQLSFPDSFLRLSRVLQLARQNADAHQIASELKSDPALSVRLLRYANSAALGLSHPISNLDQAIVMVGNQRLYRWLSLLLFSCKGDQELDQTLLETALTRARLMELAGARLFTHNECELLFLTGLFSLLDFLLRVPRTLLLKELNPPALIIDTLCGKNTAFTPYLHLAEHSELDWPCTALLTQCQLSPAEFNRLQIDATLWTLSALAS